MLNLFPRDPSIQIAVMLGPKVCKSYLHWAILIPRFSANQHETGQGKWTVVCQGPLSGTKSLSLMLNVRFFVLY